VSTALILVRLLAPQCGVPQVFGNGLLRLWRCVQGGAEVVVSRGIVRVEFDGAAICVSVTFTVTSVWSRSAIVTIGVEVPGVTYAPGSRLRLTTIPPLPNEWSRLPSAE